MTTKGTAWAFIAGLVLVFTGLLVYGQLTKTVTVAWDPMEAGQVWKEVRIYDIAVTPEVLVATAPCQAGPPVTCPTTVSFSMSKVVHNYVARSWDGNWESDNSNVVVVPGPPKPPGNVRKQ